MPLSFPTRRSSDLTPTAPGIGLRPRHRPFRRSGATPPTPTVLTGTGHALDIKLRGRRGRSPDLRRTRYALADSRFPIPDSRFRSEEHTSELQSLMRISYAVLFLKKQNNDKSVKDLHLYTKS